MSKPKTPGSGRPRNTQASRARASAGGSRGWPFFVALAAVIGLGVALVVISAGGEDEVAGGKDPIAGVVSFDVASAQHVEGTVAYAQTPPVGGDHSPPPVWQNCGYYSQPVAPEAAVHSLEHGAVWITYQPDLPADQVEVLRDLAGSYVLVSPWADGLPAPVVASAWGNQLTLDSASDPRLEAFVDAFRQGSQTPELGAPCRGGVGQPE